jgi:signal peptidase II
MTSLSRKYLYFLVTFAITLPIDQLTKRWIIDRFAYGEMLVVVPDFFNLTHVRNPGGAFSLLVGLPEFWRQAFFLGTGFLAIVLLLVFLRRLVPEERLAAVAIGAVLGGAIGNLTDRVLYGEVIDFLDFRLFGGYVWPTFNMADCWIVCGVAILMLDIFFEPGEAEDAPNAVPGTSEDHAGEASRHAGREGSREYRA